MSEGKGWVEDYVCERALDGSSRREGILWSRWLGQDFILSFVSGERGFESLV